jgi:hypothetical protein
MVSANKLYKQSGTDLPFKEWLKREQLRGKLDVHEDQFLNADGDSVSSLQGKLMPFVLGAAVGFGLCWYLKSRK